MLRDYARTEEVRRLVAEEDAREAALKRWAAYEAAWANLHGTAEPLGFADVPWPLHKPPQDTQELHDKDAIATFLFETLSFSGATRKDRLRLSLLRWHPDKLRGVVGRVREEDVEAVKDGIDAVVISLMALQDLGRTERN